jgi:protein TonB
LDNKGNILQVRLKSTSGVDELDEAAVESFNKAGPFPNPPREMLKSGKAMIEWGFVVKT